MEQYEMPPTQQLPATHLFNKLNGLYLFTVLLSREKYGPVNEELFIARWADYDIMNDVVDGQLIIHEDGTVEDAWRIVHKDEMEVVYYERNLNQQAEEKITKKYPIALQISILGKSVETLAAKAGVELEELSEMLSYIKLCLDTNKAQKEFYRGNPDVKYVADEEFAEDQAQRMAGGIHEWIGPRPVTGGRVFGTDS